jgi:hypothetical protein
MVVTGPAQSTDEGAFVDHHGDGIAQVARDPADRDGCGLLLVQIAGGGRPLEPVVFEAQGGQMCLCLVELGHRSAMAVTVTVSL